MRHLTFARSVGLATCLLLPALSALALQRGDQVGRPSASPPVPAASEAGISVFFSPNGGAGAAVVAVINSARSTLDVEAYLLSTKDIIAPIAKAQQRGVKVRVVMDANNAGDQYSGATYLSNAGVPVFLDSEHKEAHNKVMLIDGKTIVTGSFNFTRAADEQNAENLLVIDGKPRLFAAYKKNFESHLKHSKPYERSSGSREPHDRNAK
jgi:phosphatidylserine/phosphatidylglycerophosphate/cardiolipin synthase-like enzyme